MEFDWKVSIGSVISALGVMITVLGIYWHMAGRLQEMETKLNIMFTWFTRTVIGKEADDQVRDLIKQFFTKGNKYDS